MDQYSIVNNFVKFIALFGFTLITGYTLYISRKFPDRHPFFAFSSSAIGDYKSGLVNFIKIIGIITLVIIVYTFFFGK